MPTAHISELPDGSKAFQATLHVAAEKFWDPALRPPPYPSVANYDAKVWQFVEDYGEEGDYVWNVGCDVPEEKGNVGAADREAPSADNGTEPQPKKCNVNGSTDSEK